MLSNFRSVATAAVKDLDAAKRFYADKLGLKQIGSEGQEAVTYKTAGDTTLLVYRSQYAGQNGATAVTWNVDDIQDVVRDLKSKGVTFEHYDMPGVTRQGDIHLTGKSKAAWFKDPDGNIIALVGR